MKSLRCACGTCIEAETGRQLLEAVEAHVLAAHASPLEDATASPVVPEAAEQPISDDNAGSCKTLRLDLDEGTLREAFFQSR
jgi:hypothetical protein